MAGRLRQSVFSNFAPGRRASRGITEFPLVVLGVFLLVASGVFLGLTHFYHVSSQTAEQRPVSFTPANTDLKMRVDPQSNAVLVGWNSAIPALRSARRGILQIDDGSQSHTAELRPADLVNGSFRWNSGAAEMNFRLTVYTADGSTLTEALRLLDTSKEKKSADAGWSGKSSSSDSPDKRTEQSSELKEAISSVTMAPRPVQNPSDAFASPPAVNPEANQPQVNQSTPQFDVAAVDSPKPPPPLPEPVAPPPATTVTTDAHALQPVSAPPPSASASSAATGKTSGKYVFPEPLQTVTPSVSIFGRSFPPGVSQIEVEVMIDQSGHVTSARLLHRNDNVSWVAESALIAAAKKWTFQPAKLDGRNVAARHTIVFHFSAP